MLRFLGFLTGAKPKRQVKRAETKEARSKEYTYDQYQNQGQRAGNDIQIVQDSNTHSQEYSDISICCSHILFHGRIIFVFGIISVFWSTEVPVLL